MHAEHPLKLYRESKSPKQSQEGLAKELGVARLTVVRWETGERKIGERLLPLVTKKTGLSAEKLRPDLVKRLEKLVGGVQ